MAKILIIDDDPGFRRMMNATLTRDGHTVTDARDGREGLNLFNENRPDLVICDIVMPEKEGIQTMLEILAASPATPVIAISGGGGVIGGEYLAMAQKLGAQGILSKPFRLVELTGEVNRCLKQVQR